MLEQNACRWPFTRPVAVSLPFTSTFNRGSGAAFAQNGTPVFSSWWMNLSLQDPQPLWLGPGTAAADPHLAKYTAAPFEGSASFCCFGDVSQGKAHTVPLFICACPVYERLFVSYTCTEHSVPHPELLGTGSPAPCSVALQLTFCCGDGAQGSPDSSRSQLAVLLNPLSICQADIAQQHEQAWEEVQPSGVRVRSPAALVLPCCKSVDVQPIHLLF